MVFVLYVINSKDRCIRLLRLICLRLPRLQGILHTGQVQLHMNIWNRVFGGVTTKWLTKLYHTQNNSFQSWSLSSRTNFPARKWDLVSFEFYLWRKKTTSKLRRGRKINVTSQFECWFRWEIMMRHW